LGESLAENLVSSFGAVGLVSRSGATVRALSYVGGAERTGDGWSIGVGNVDVTGEENDPAPAGTLRAFFEDNPYLTPSPWRRIPQAYKEKLEAMRRSGMYGGRSSEYANYMWVQDRGSSEAMIKGRNFISRGLDVWRGNAPAIINRYLNGT
jgi:hypothetical protein